MKEIRIGISSCLIGRNVRYDGGHAHDRYITDTLGRYFTWIPVCPEVEYGLPVPREAMHLTGNPQSPHIITIRTGIDHTAGIQEWTENKLRMLEHDDLCGFIFKSKSPSSGIAQVKIYSRNGFPVARGAGIFGGAFMQRFPLIPIIDEGRLHDPVLRENFIERVFVYHRWKELTEQKMVLRDLIHFHTDHKLLIMSHSGKYLSMLGRLIAGTKDSKTRDLFAHYIVLLMEGLKLIATVKKNTNVLFHAIGYFRKQISPDEKQELIDIIDNYHKGYIPLIAPVVLINHYVKRLNDQYLKRQYYLNPHPLELMLRNHT
jgi:uncharacterized protein YbgA (DUF1722 family)/uncharacterized protein YbbK (DUF523 family)